MSVCVCGGDFIDGPFGQGQRNDEATARALGAALRRFLQRVGSASEDTVNEWVAVRDRLALDLALAQLLEAGKVEVIGRDAQGNALLANREPAREAGT